MRAFSLFLSFLYFHKCHSQPCRHCKRERALHQQPQRTEANFHSVFIMCLLQFAFALRPRLVVVNLFRDGMKLQST